LKRELKFSAIRIVVKPSEQITVFDPLKGTERVWRRQRIGEHGKITVICMDQLAKKLKGW